MYILKKKFVNKELMNYYVGIREGHKVYEFNKIGKARRDIFYSNEECSLLDSKLFKKNGMIHKIKEKFNILLEYRERYKLGTYSGKNKSRRGKHTDTLGKKQRHRQISMVICFSKSSKYGGGLLNIIHPITKKIKSFKLDQGDAIFFDSNLTHWVEPVTYGKRKVIITFMWGNETEHKRYLKLKRDINRYIPNVRGSRASPDGESGGTASHSRNDDPTP